MSAVTTGSSLRTSLEQVPLSGGGYDVDEASFASVLSSQMGISPKEASTLINIAQEALGRNPKPAALIDYILAMLQVDGGSNEQVNNDAAMNSDITEAVKGALQELAPSGKFDAENPTDIKNLMEITGISEKDVKDLITKTGGDVLELMVLMFDVDGDSKITISELDENKGSDYYDAMQKLMEDSMKKEADAIKNTTNAVQAASDTVKSLAQSMKSKPTAARSGKP
jgi:hypothetical protein